MLNSSQFGASVLVLPPYHVEQLMKLRHHPLPPKRKLSCFKPEMHIEALRSSSFLNFSLECSRFTSIFTPFPTRLRYAVYYMRNCTYEVGNMLSFKMYKDICVYSYFHQDS